MFMIIIQLFFSHYLRYNFIMQLRQHLNPVFKSKFINSLKINKNTVEQVNIQNNIKLPISNLKPCEKDKRESDSSNVEILEPNQNNNLNKLIKRKSVFQHDAENKNLVESNKLSKLPNNNSEFKFYNNYIEEERTTNKLTEKNNHHFKEVNKFCPVEKIPKQNSIFTDNISILNKLNKGDKNFFNFEFIDFQSLNYIKFVTSIICCQKIKKEKYLFIRSQIEELFDIYNFGAFLKNEYSKVNPFAFYST